MFAGGREGAKIIVTPLSSSDGKVVETVKLDTSLALWFVVLYDEQSVHFRFV